MRFIEINKNFEKNGTKFLEGHKYVMAEDVEAQLRSVSGDAMGMSYPIENIYRPYKGEDLTGKRIMAWRTGGIGDLHFISPVFKYLKKRYPGCFIRMASACKQPLENLPEIDELYDMPFDVKLLEDMDFHLFFQGIIESGSEQSKKIHAVDMFFSYFKIDSTQFPPEDKVPRIVLSDNEKKWVVEECNRLGLGQGDLVVGIQMETSSPLRNYPKEKLKVVIDILARENKVKIILVGTVQQNILANFFKGNLNNVIPAVNYDVRKSIVFASRYNIIISPDSFLVQTAGALDKPLIGLYGPFPSEVRMKYFKNAIGMEAKVVCSPCFKHDFRTCIKGFPSPCFSLIEPEDILQAINYQRNKFYGGHFNYMAPLFNTPDFSEIEQYFLSADKGLCFFGAYFNHQNMIRVDANKFVKADINDLNYPFEWRKYPFVLFMNNFGYQNGAIFNNCRNFIRPGGYFIIYRENCVEPIFNELKKDIGKTFILMYSKFDPVKKTGTVVGKKPF
jgi:ADP-heptose:LPS heptosyltransferase